MKDEDKGGLGANNVSIGGTWNDDQGQSTVPFPAFGSLTIHDTPNTTTVDIAGIAQGLQKKGK